MNTTTKTILTLSTFTALLTLFYALGYWLIYRMGQATPLMLSVGMATVATCLVWRISLKDLGWHWGKWKDQWKSYLIPFQIALVAYLVIWLFGFAGFYNQEFLDELKADYNLKGWGNLAIFIFHIALVSSISFIVSLPSILGEEIGWRGLLFAELSKVMSFTGVALVTGVAWSIFHWPLIFNGLYGASITPIYYKIVFFSLFIIATSVVMAYYRMKTGSLWTAVVYHASSNIFIQKVFTPITVESSKSAWYVDEFGSVLAIVACCAAVYYWRKGVVEFGEKATNEQG